MNRVFVVAALIGVTAVLPLEAQGRAQGQNRNQTQSRGQGQSQDRNGTQTMDRNGSQAQGRGPVAVPPGHWPSAGRCRVWIDGVAPGRQPRETDCATARRTVPPNGRVLEGPSRYPDDRYGRTDRYGRDDDDRYGDDDDDRVTRRFIDRNGLECEEKAVTKNGKRSYDLKCREPKHRNQPGNGWPPISARDDRYCLDANRDGRCDAGSNQGYPTTLPEMIGAIVYGQGQRTSDVSRWLGTGRYQVRYTDQNSDRRPERVRWMDAAGALLQEWTDTNRDGRADVVNVYSAGRLIRSIGGR